MPEALWEIVSKYRSKGIEISDKEAEKICQFCYRKMEVAKIENKEEYLPKLFEDEVRNHIFRETVNSISIFMDSLKEEVQYV